MSGQWRFLLLFVIMAVVAIATGAIAIGILYNTAFDEERQRLAEMAASQARLIGAVARFEQANSGLPQAQLAETVIDHIKQAHRSEHGIGETGEFVLGRRDADQIVPILSRRHSPTDPPRPIPTNSDLAEPMRRALTGESGTIIAKDYRGVLVLAAYEPVPILDLGIVAKIDLSEIRAPFIRAGAIIAAAALVLIAIGTFVFSAVSTPIIRKIREGEERFRALFENMRAGAVVCGAIDDGADFSLRDLNRAGERIDGLDRRAALGRPITEVSRRFTTSGLLEVMRRVYRTGVAEHVPAAFYPDDRGGGWRESYVYRLPNGEIVDLCEDVTDRKKAEAALQDREQRFRNITETASDAIISVDSAGKVVSWNRSAERIFGYTAAEMMAQPLLKLIPDRYHEAHAAGMKRAVQSPDGQVMANTVEIEGLRKDGTEIPVELSLATWTLGEDRYFTGIVRDISERKRAEAALRESEARLRSIIETQTVAIMIVDHDKRIRFANKAAETLFERNPRELIGAPFGFPVVDGDVSEIAINRPTRGIAYAEMRAIPMQWESGEQHLLFLHDVTAHRRAAGDLHKLFQAIEQSPVSVVITDVDGRIEYVNPKFTQATGYTYAEVVGKNPRILSSGQMPSETYRELWETITSGNVWNGEFRNKRKNGELFWELASIAPIRDIRGQVTHYVAVKEDITERRATEEQLREAQKMEVVGQLTGGIAHDFNNLLAIIIGNLQLLAERPDTDAEGRELITDALWSAERGAELVRGLLAFSRRQRLNPTITDLNRVVRQMTELIRRTLGERIRIASELTPGLWATMIDKSQLETALLNLVVNARDAIPDGGVLTLATANAALDEEATEIGEGQAAAEYAVVSVTDTGTGMPPEVVEHIFEPFFTTKKVGKGSGLGLSMVYGFVKQSGGQVVVDSEVGRGTTVKLYLPKARATAKEAPASAGATPLGPPADSARRG